MIPISKNPLFDHLQGAPGQGQSSPALSQPSAPSIGAEQESSPFGATEYGTIQEYVEPSIPPEVQPHVQQVANQFIPIPNTIPMQSTTVQMNIQPVTYPNIPLNELEIEKELKTNIYTAIRWLAEWCLRQIKILDSQEK